MKIVFLSTLPARGATHLEIAVFAAVGISIHAPREGSDIGKSGCRPSRNPFLSTLPARGATGLVGDHGRDHEHFYPRSPRGERQPRGSYEPRGVVISIHAPREGSDEFTARRNHHEHYFYPRSPRGERPLSSWPVRFSLRGFLSTLPARGATQQWQHPKTALLYFYPRSPRGERQLDSVPPVVL